VRLDTVADRLEAVVPTEGTIMLSAAFVGDLVTALREVQRRVDEVERLVMSAYTLGPIPPGRIIVKFPPAVPPGTRAAPESG
jgi:hypothetical protein